VLSVFTTPFSWRRLATAACAPRPLSAALCCALVALPPLATQFPPSADLPQHVAQVRLFWETLRHEPPTGGVSYVIQWTTPYSLLYILLGFAWPFLAPEDVGRFALATLGVLWTLAAHGLAAWRGRSPAAAVLASLLFYSHITYWGFLSFAVGWPVFALLLVMTSPDYVARQTSPMRDGAAFLGTFLLLYMAHALWFAVGTLWWAASGVVFRLPRRGLLTRAAWLAPLVIGAAASYAALSRETRFVTHHTIWSAPAGVRLFTDWLPGAVFGGLKGPLEGATLFIFGCWTAAGLFFGLRRKATFDWHFGLAGAMFLILGLSLPYQFQYTIEFAERWMPVAMILLLLSAPALNWRPAVERTACLAAAAAFCVATAVAWNGFEKKELSGLRAALAALPARPRVAGLDFVKESADFRRRPFIQMAAYGQVARGGTLSLSFAKFPQMFVTYAPDAKISWTDGLEWNPEALKPSDVKYFDFALVNADDARHARFLRDFPQATPVSDGGTWRLYRFRSAQ
jgi:hypothetical protein